MLIAPCKRKTARTLLNKMKAGTEKEKLVRE
jgi:hypothetical protein